MLSDKELIVALEASPSPNRVTPEYLKSRIGKVEFIGPDKTGGTLTICLITMDNGFQLTGISACADPANYNKEVGEKISYDNAERQIWPLLGFLLREMARAREILKTSQANVDKLKDGIADSSEA